MRRNALVVLAAALAGAAVYAGTVLATPGSGVTATPIAQATFPPMNINANALPKQLWLAFVKTFGNSDVYVTDNKIAPGGATGWHTHPGPSLVLVTAGTVTNYTSGNCAGQSYSAGSGFVDAGGQDVHMLKNNSTTTAAETVAVQIVAQGAPRKIDEPAPPGCSP